MRLGRTVLWSLALSLGAATLALGAGNNGRAKYDRDRAVEILDDVAKSISKNYYDPKMNGLDWKALEAKARAEIDHANTNGQMLGIISAFVNRLHDSHTFFITPLHVASVKFGFEAEPVGKRILVYELSEDGPASRAGLELGDQIIAVNGFRAVRASFDEMMLYFRVLDPVAQMNLVVVRGGSPPRTIAVKADVKTGQKLNDLTDLNSFFELTQEELSHKDPAGHRILEDGIGYVRWSAFVGDPGPLRWNLEKVRKAPAIILDLRDNLGGSVDTLKTMVGFFVSKPVDLAELKGRKKSKPIKVTPHRPALTQPLFILVDSESASAAEIFARYFQETGRATIIGDRTSGRVAEARIFTQSEGMDTAVIFGIEVDVGHVIFSGGEDLEHRGITPDKPCLPSPSDLHSGRDPCLNLAVRLAEAAIKPARRH